MEEPDQPPKEPSTGAKIILRLNRTAVTVTNPGQSIPAVVEDVTVLEPHSQAGEQNDADEIEEAVTDVLPPQLPLSDMVEQREEAMRITPAKRGRPSRAANQAKPKTARPTRGATRKSTTGAPTVSPAPRRSLRSQNAKVSEAVRNALASEGDDVMEE
jgi:hypothetical protein